MMAFGQDDGIELDGGQCNVRMFDNRIEQTMVGFSTAPNKRGPSYIFDNLIWNLGNEYGRATAGVKNGGGSEHSIGIQYLINNTISVDGSVMVGVGYGKKDDRALFNAITRNNIFLTDSIPGQVSVSGKTAYAIADKVPSNQNNFDYDRIANNYLPDGKGKVMARSGNEVHGVFSSPLFSKSLNGNFTLQPKDDGIAKGLIVANFNQGVNGKIPDLGAFQLGASSLTPARPIAIEADKYFLLLTVGQPQVITVKTGDIAGRYTYTICKNDKMEWLDTDRPSGEMTANSELKIKFVAKPSEVIQNGVVIIRMDNGFSIPITVKVKKG
jgi:hypothetical protein